MWYCQSTLSNCIFPQSNLKNQWPYLPKAQPHACSHTNCTTDNKSLVLSKQSSPYAQDEERKEMSLLPSSSLHYSKLLFLFPLWQTIGVDSFPSLYGKTDTSAKFKACLCLGFGEEEKAGMFQRFIFNFLFLCLFDTSFSITASTTVGIFKHRHLSTTRMPHFLLELPRLDVHMQL